VATQRTLVERARLKPWTHGPVRQGMTSPRLGTGRPPNASKAIADKLIQFLVRHTIPLNAFSRHTRISAWAIRQARDGKRNLPPIQEKLIDVTIERLRSGKLWLRRVNSQRWDLEWINPPYKPSCPTGAVYCTGGLLPGSCPKRWRECALYASDWQAVAKIHKADVEQKA
jgi:hypothetical protein